MSERTGHKGNWLIRKKTHIAAAVLAASALTGCSASTPPPEGGPIPVDVSASPNSGSQGERETIKIEGLPYIDTEKAKSSGVTLLDNLAKPKTSASTVCRARWCDTYGYRDTSDFVYVGNQYANDKVGTGSIPETRAVYVTKSKILVVDSINNTYDVSLMYAVSEDDDKLIMQTARKGGENNDIVEILDSMKSALKGAKVVGVSTEDGKNNRNDLYRNNKGLVMGGSTSFRELAFSGLVTDVLSHELDAGTQQENARGINDNLQRITKALTE